MSDQSNQPEVITPNSLATVANTGMSVYGERSEVREMSDRLGLMIQNGKKLQSDERMALAQYSVGNGLNPFIGEAYYMPGIGPMPGIAGWRKKADEQLEYERKQAGKQFARWNAEYTDPNDQELASFGKVDQGDIIVKAILHDTLSKTDWEDRVLKAMLEIYRAGIKEGAEATKLARELIGPEPVWTAIGCVRVGENFGGDKMSRYERACKRAEKAALRKRFPRINLPEPHVIDGDVIDEPAVIVEQPEPKIERRSVAENLAQLGFN